jgi:hypothetical protein
MQTIRKRRVGREEFKNSSADSKVLISKPTDLICLSSDLRTEISSSTNAISGCHIEASVFAYLRRRNVLLVGVVADC